MLPFTQVPSLKKYTVQRDLGILLAVVVVCAVPFLSQPFHMDDNFYMDMARNVRVKPLYPNDVAYVFEGKALPDMGSHSHPPLQTYFLATLQNLTGEGEGKEWVYHLLALIYPIVSVLAMYFLAARFVERPIWPSLSLATSPVFLVMQHNLMTDVPTLAFWLGAVAAFLWGVELRSRSLHLVSALFLVAAIFASYQSAALLPLLGFYQLRRGKGIQGWITLLVPIAAMLAWLGLSYSHYHRFLLWDTLGYVQSGNPTTLTSLKTKLIALLEYQGWLTIFPLFLLLVFARSLKGRFLGLLALVAVYLSQLVISNYRLLEKAIFVVGLVAGALVAIRLTGLFLEAFFKQRADMDLGTVEAQFLGLWYAGVFGYCVFLLTDGSARYILPLLPPLLLYFFRALEVLEVQEYRLKQPTIMNSGMIAAGALTISLVFGLMLSDADQEFARVYPRVAREVSRIGRGLETYYAGEWGFRYYLHQAGVRQIPVDESQVHGGSLIVTPMLALPYDLPAGLWSMLMPFQTLDYGARTPVRILDRRSHAAFYSTGWGLLPFSLSRNRVEMVEIKQVNFMVDKLPWARIESSSGVLPWPGYLSLRGEEPLAVLARPGSQLTYPWRAPDPLNLEMKYGVSPDAYVEGQAASFQFDIRQYDAQGAVLSSFTRVLEPVRRKEERGWQLVRLQLRSRSEGGETLVFRYSARGWTSSGIGAFAETYLRWGEPEKAGR